MQVNKMYLENKLSELGKWVESNPNHPMIQAKRGAIKYYTAIAQYMDEHKLNVIEMDGVHNKINLSL